MKEAVLIFDIGKTNKKFFLFDRQLNILFEEEETFEEIPDDDGFPGDDIARIEAWIIHTTRRLTESKTYRILGVNFATYGATLVYLDKQGKRLTPAYNYLKPMPEGIAESIYQTYGGKAEFCRCTASPALGMLNAGFQARWLREMKEEIYTRVETILHFPQYLHYLLTGSISSEHTSIGCHTALWDFDQMTYHAWTSEMQSMLPAPDSVYTTFPSKGLAESIPVGIGIHDSSSSLVPYFMGSDRPFILLSTGTWCISMNPYNDEPLTLEQLENDCLSYLSIQQKPVKSSRLFMGHMHDARVKELADLYGVPFATYKTIKPDVHLIHSLQRERPEPVFFKENSDKDLQKRSIHREDFPNYTEAYHKLMIELSEMTVTSIQRIIPSEDSTENLYISGGFSKNELFLYLISSNFPGKKIYATGIQNATAVGAAMVLWKALDPSFTAEIDLNLNQ